MSPKERASKIVTIREIATLHHNLFGAAVYGHVVGGYHHDRKKAERIAASIRKRLVADFERWSKP